MVLSYELNQSVIEECTCQINAENLQQRGGSSRSCNLHEGIICRQQYSDRIGQMVQAAISKRMRRQSQDIALLEQCSCGDIDQTDYVISDQFMACQAKFRHPRTCKERLAATQHVWPEVEPILID